MWSSPEAFAVLFAQSVILVGLLSSAAYCLAMLYSAHTFFAPGTEADGTHGSPAVTVLKPLKGLDAELYDNLRRLCEQDYERFQLVFGVADAGDPAAGVVRRLQREYPEVDMELVVDTRVHGSNCKVSNLHNMYARARHEIIVIADSDIRVSRLYLRELVRHLRDPSVGLVTAMYRAVNTGGLPTLVESLCINTDWCHMVLVARVAERPTYAFGATIALRRAVLDEIGGFLPIADYLADDYQLGQRVAARGYQIVLSAQVLETVTAVAGWRALFQHQLRWARTCRICRPGGYFASILTHTTLWAVANLAWHGLTTSSCLVSGGLIGMRYLCAGLLSWRYLGADTTRAQLLLVTAKDLFVSALWLLAFAGNTVTWSGRRFRVRRSGKMVDITRTGTAPMRTGRAVPPLPRPARLGGERGNLE
jgi:ceramide glucosyltransferase